MSVRAAHPRYFERFAEEGVIGGEVDHGSDVSERASARSLIGCLHVWGQLRLMLRIFLSHSRHAGYCGAGRPHRRVRKL